MRGQVNRQSEMFCLLAPASRVPQHHPLRQVKALVDQVRRDNATHESTTDREGLIAFLILSSSNLVQMAKLPGSPPRTMPLAPA